MATTIKLEIVDKGSALQASFSVDVDGTTTANGDLVVHDVAATVNALNELKAKLPSAPKT